MAKLKLAFLDCRNCRVWGDLPEGFKETKHFGKCPKCGQPMFLCRGIDPINELAYRLENKVVCGLMLHGVDLDA